LVGWKEDEWADWWACKMVVGMVEQMAVMLVVLSVGRRENKSVEPLGHWRAVAMVGL
jgi:hypothetical protein